MPTTSTLDLYRLDLSNKVGQAQIRHVLEDHGVDEGLKDWIFHVIENHRRGYEEGYKDGYKAAEDDQF